LVKDEITVLVVEDEAATRLAVCEHLAHDGFKVFEAVTAAQALEVLQLHPEIDTVFTDLLLPGGMDGLELTQWLLQHRPDLPIVLTSGVWQRTAAMNALARSERLPYFIKPYQYAAVSDKIRELVETPRHQASH